MEKECQIWDRNQYKDKFAIHPITIKGDEIFSRILLPGEKKIVIIHVYHYSKTYLRK